MLSVRNKRGKLRVIKHFSCREVKYLTNSYFTVAGRFELCIYIAVGRRLLRVIIITVSSYLSTFIARSYGIM